MHTENRVLVPVAVLCVPTPDVHSTGACSSKMKRTNSHNIYAFTAVYSLHHIAMN